MQDISAKLEKLRTDAIECALIRDLATDPKKRELFGRLADHLGNLAQDVEEVVTGVRALPRGDVSGRLVSPQ
ncbi:hypothetical protein JQ607_35260 [Bradyrhizobium liaoningense]|uniref:hypothetical protein n=1 Tax=Bradyrhizobium liaoningense TaxID=43992 RepID=UPI001BACBDA2|nr:hypothetical protein [Bradyrhizobium liaoningense]MBR0845477.1 hypothetical protein [Bradyrhizobium liaoningense]MBR0855386.1 hypothetical protein [Bradyrhizobium liaoningense]